MLVSYDNFNNYYSQNFPLCLLEKGDEYCVPKYSIKRASSPIYAMEYIVEGRNDYIINGQSISALPGDVIFLPKKSRHVYSNVKGFECHKKWFVFDGDFMKQLELYYLPKDKYCFHIDNVEEIFDKIISLKASNGEEYNETLKQFSLCLYELLIEIYNNENLQMKNDETVAQKMKKYIDENIMEDITLEKLAKKFHYSKNHTIVIFRNQFGITPNKYFSQKKIELACLYLRNTNLSVKTISEQLKFADQHYFSNVFSKCMNMSPIEFRESLEMKDIEEHANYIPKI